MYAQAYLRACFRSESKLRRLLGEAAALRIRESASFSSHCKASNFFSRKSLPCLPPSPDKDPDLPITSRSLFMASLFETKPIDLLKGWPSKHLLPTLEFTHSANKCLDDASIAQPAFEYAPDWGYEPLREALASWLSDFYRPQDSVSPQRLCITGGASQNLSCILQVYTDPIYTRHIWLISPTYYLACRIFEDAGFHGRLKSIPEDGEGINLDFLRQELQKSEADATQKGNTSPV